MKYFAPQSSYICRNIKQNFQKCLWGEGANKICDEKGGYPLMDGGSPPLLDSPEESRHPDLTHHQHQRWTTSSAKKSLKQEQSRTNQVREIYQTFLCSKSRILVRMLPLSLYNIGMRCRRPCVWI